MENPEQLAQLRVLQRQYFQLVEPQQLRWPDDATLKRPLVQAWLFGNLFDPSKISSPPPARYQLRVLKELVGKLERSMTDPEEDVWSPISSLRFLPLLCTAMYHSKRHFVCRNQPVAASADFALVPCYRKSQMISWKQ